MVERMRVPQQNVFDNEQHYNRVTRKIIHLLGTHGEGVVRGSMSYVVLPAIMHALTQLPPEVRTDLVSHIHKYIDRQVQENHENTILYKGAAESLIELLETAVDN